MYTSNSGQVREKKGKEDLDSQKYEKVHDVTSEKNQKNWRKLKQYWTFEDNWRITACSDQHDLVFLASTMKQISDSDSQFCVQNLGAHKGRNGL